MTLRETLKPLRIALTDEALLRALQELQREPEYLLVPPEGLGALVGKADFFVLDDDTAIRFLGGRSEETWPGVVVTARDGESVPASFRQGLADDLLVLPLRALDVERVIRAHDYVQALRGLEESSRGVEGLVRRLQEDISLAQKIQRRLIRERFPPFGALSLRSRYWCGLKSGGDYFDFFELPGGAQAGVILSDSSSYSLSTSLLGALMQFFARERGADPEEPQRAAQALFDKVREGMKEADHLSLLYGVFDRRSYSLRLTAHGAVFLAKRSPDGRIEWAARGERPPLSLGMPPLAAAGEIVLEPGDRLMACSDGWGPALGEGVPALMERFLGREGEAQDIVDGMAFALRSALEKRGEQPPRAADEFPLPPDDCSVLVFDLASRALRLAPGGSR